MKRKNYTTSAILIVAILLHALPISAQTKKQSTERQISVNLLPVRDASEAFRAFRKIGGGVFPQLLGKIMSEAEAGDTIDALEAQAVNFNDELEEFSKDDLSKTAEKSKEISRKNYEELKKNPPQVQTQRTPRAYGKSFAGENPFDEAAQSDFLNQAIYRKANFQNSLFQNASYAKTNAAGDEPKFETVETDSSVSTSGADSRTIDLPDATVTRSAKVDGKTSFDGKAWTEEKNQSETTDAVSKTSKQKVTQTNKQGATVSFDVCPDANGVVRGAGKVRFFSQQTTNTGSEIAALTTETIVDFKITGYVNDDAVMTHFDMVGTATETLTGFDRATQRDLIKSVAGFSDGARRINFQIKNNQPPAFLRDEYGMSKGEKDYEFGQIEATASIDLSEEQMKRIGDAGLREINLAMLYLQRQMKSSISNWENGGCVDVECTAPKRILKSGETVNVKATSVSKKDLSKFNAKLEGSGTVSVAPKNQTGTPQAVFALTAPGKGKAQIIVKSVSKRGIGLGILDFGTEDANDRDDKNCDGNWHGTLTISETFEDVYKETTNAGDVKSDPRLSGWKENVNRKKYEAQVKLGAPVSTSPTSSLFNGTYMASATGFYRDESFFTTPNECGSFVKKTISSSSGVEENETDAGEGAAEIMIQIYDGAYRGSASIPEISGTSFRRTWHHPAGYCQENNNKPTDESNTTTTNHGRKAIAFEGAIDLRQPNVLTGTKTIPREDGKGATVITWSIKRCLPAKPSRKPPVRKK